MNGHTKYLRNYIWKMKFPLKIKIFVWFLHHKVLLTKDNLVKRSWKGCKTCINFFHNNETIQHFFFECSFAKIIRRIIRMTFGLTPPTIVTNLFGNLLAGIPKKELVQIRVGVCAVLWAI
jgi:hypothetical protein